MKTLTAKQEARLEKKKRKLAALAEIMKLNDKDRALKGSDAGITSSSSESLDEDNHSEDKKVLEKQNFEPANKRMKYEQEVKGEEISNDFNDEFKDDQTKSLGIEGDQLKITLTQEQYVQIKRELNARKRQLVNGPKLRLRPFGELAMIDVESEKRTPLFLTDIQNLLMLALLGSSSPCSPSRWCYIEKSSRITRSTVLIVEGLSLFHFLSYESKFVDANKIFSHKLEVIMPPYKEGSILNEIATVPLTHNQQDELIAKYGSLEAALESQKKPITMVKTLFPIEEHEDAQPENNVESLKKPEKISRTTLLLSALQMADENYPLPMHGQLSKHYYGYVMSKDSYKKVHDNSPMFAVDCEMCKTTSGLNELTRISIVDENLEQVYETLVRPTNKIVDYLTPYSGITPKMMLHATKTLQEVQKDVRELLPPDAILIGQSLNSDLHAMKMMHPYVIDTSVIYNITGERKRKSKLQTLMKLFFGETIQEKLDGHDSIEDSQASMKLVKLKLINGIDFGDAVLKSRKKANEDKKEKQKVAEKETKTNLFSHIVKSEKRTAVVTTPDLNLDFDDIFNKKAHIISKDECNEPSNDPSMINCFKTDSNKTAIRKALDIAHEYSLNIINLSIPPQRLELSKIDKTISNIDKWIAKLWDRVAYNGLFTVLFGGAPGSPSGAVMLNIKKSNHSDAETDSPIAV